MPLLRLIALSSVVRDLCAMPLVPTQDWCDRAAETMARAHQPSLVVIAGLAWQPGGEGERLPTIEALGVGSSLVVPPFSPDSSMSTIAELRTRAEYLLHLGSFLKVIGVDKPVCDRTSIIAGPDELDRCNSFWAGLGVGEHVIGIARGGWAPDRRLVCMVATADSGDRFDPISILVLRVALEELAARAAIALAPILHGQRHWISPRERQVLDLLITGKSVREAAKVLGRSQHTVHDHVKSLYRKLNTRTRGELVARALGHHVELVDAHRRIEPKRPALARQPG